MNLRRYDLTPEQYDEMSAAQGHVCAACGEPERGRNQFGPISLAVDHDHDSGAVRGLLCGDCNRALGLLKDSKDRALSLADYIGRFQ